MLLNGTRNLPGFLKNSAVGLAYGMGRSYGDVCLNSGGILWHTTLLNRFIFFDNQTGVLKCEAGVLLRDIQRLMMPRGWMLPVTPGTQLITVGGAVANDVHGKNHHIFGSFGDHVVSIKLIRTDGEMIECGPNHRVDWFAATVGGLGLTGVIAEIEIQLRRIVGGWLNVETIPYTTLGEFFVLAEESERDWEYTVSWVDCSSESVVRGIFMRANHAHIEKQVELKDYRLNVPFTPPFSLMNRLSLRVFNMLYYNLHKRNAGYSVANYESFFYPLDNILEWNRIYGPKGFFQYQSVVPQAAGKAAIHCMLKEIARSGEGSFLAILKTFGNRSASGMLSFPQAGATLALDFSNMGESTIKLFNRLDNIVREAGGRIYPAKDARMPRDLFEAGYPNLDVFLKYRDLGISSDLSRRLMGY